MKLLFCIFPLFLLSLSLFSQVGVIRETTGDVLIMRNTRDTNNSVGDEIFEYDFIKVGNNSNVKISLYIINGVSAELTFYSNTNFFVSYSPLKDSQDAKIYLFKGSADVKINKITKGSSLSVNIGDYLISSSNASKFYINNDYFNNFFVIVTEGVLNHYNKNEYFIGEGTALLLFNGNSLLYKMNEITFKGSIENFKRIAMGNFITASEINSNYFLSENIEDTLRFNYLYDYLIKDDNLKAIYSKWNTEDESHRLGNRLEMIGDLSFLKGKMGLIFNNFVNLASNFYFIEDIVKYHKNNSRKLIVYENVSKFLASYKSNYDSLEKNFFKIIHILKMYLTRTNGDFPSSLSPSELYLLKPSNF